MHASHVRRARQYAPQKYAAAYGTEKLRSDIKIEGK
jgi:hypothetical protein